MSSITEAAREQLMGEIMDRAATDQMFRSQLMEDPVPAIRSEFGVEIPHSYRIRFIERDRDLDALVVLPDFAGDPIHGNGELCDDDLDHVCGGTGDDPEW